MEFVFFIYGLAFFLMGFAVLNYPKKGSSFFLARKIHFVALFGIIHGANEWLDMFIMIDAMRLTFFLRLVRMMTLPTSFLCLVYFGSEIISSRNQKCSFCKFLTPGLLVVWAAVFFSGGVFPIAVGYLVPISVVFHRSDIHRNCLVDACS